MHVHSHRAMGDLTCEIVYNVFSFTHPSARIAPLINTAALGLLGMSWYLTVKGSMMGGMAASECVVGLFMLVVPMSETMGYILLGRPATDNESG